MLQFTNEEQKLVTAYNRVRFNILSGEYPIADMTPTEMAGNLILTRGNARLALGYLANWQDAKLTQTRDFSKIRSLLEACVHGVEN